MNSNPEFDQRKMDTSKGRKFKVGIVGAGYVSAYHIRAIQALASAEVVGIADPNQERAQEMAKRFGIPAVFRSLAEMRSAGPNVIHVLTPPDSHCAVTLEALDMGCDVFVEKPMASTVEECDRMIARSRQAGRVLSVNHSARMDPIVRKALELVRQGACGDILTVDFIRSSDYPPYAGGAVPPYYRDGSYPFQDLGVHGLCLLEAFLGPIQSADVRPVSTGKDPNLFFDEWHALVNCARGTGRMYISWNVRLPRNEIVIHGTRGILNVDCYLQSCIVRKTLPAPKVIQLFWAVGTSSVSNLVNAARTALRFATGKLRPNPGIHDSAIEFYGALAASTPVPVSSGEGRSMVYWMQKASRWADAEKRARLAVSAPVPKARILVTGAAGRLGRALVKRLRAQGETVRVLARRPNPALEQDPRVHVVYGDLGDPLAVDRAVEGIDVVYHVGATMRGRGWADFECGTVRGTQNVVDACLRHGIGRLVHVSSVTVLDYARLEPDSVVDENTQIETFPERRGYYTQAKVEAERIVMDAIHYRQLPGVIVRPGQIFGPGSETEPPFGTVAVGGRWIVIGSGGLRLPLVYIEDVVDALEAAAVRDGVCGSVFQLVDPVTVDQESYIEFCRWKNPVKVIHMPRVVLYGLAFVLELLGKALHRNVPLTRYKVRSIKAPSAFDCGLAARGLDWSPRVGTERGLIATFSNRNDADAAACVEELVTK
jgi:predicted dehydrogenase/nucleoside-diphosphate-sugar epimerase